MAMFLQRISNIDDQSEECRDSPSSIGAFLFLFMLCSSWITTEIASQSLSLFNTSGSLFISNIVCTLSLCISIIAFVRVLYASSIVCIRSLYVFSSSCNRPIYDCPWCSIVSFRRIRMVSDHLLPSLSPPLNLPRLLKKNWNGWLLLSFDPSTSQKMETVGHRWRFLTFLIQ